VFSSMWLLGEKPGRQDYVALVLMLISLSTVLLGPAVAASSAAPAKRPRQPDAVGR